MGFGPCARRGLGVLGSPIQGDDVDGGGEDVSR
jgi:hypothetical protein